MSSEAASSKRRLSDSLIASANNLENLISHRNSIEDLESKNIYKQGGALASKSKELENKIISNNLNKSLDHRPSINEVISSGIAGNNTDLAPSLQSVANNLARHMTEDNINRSLNSRPDVNELRASGVLTEENVAPRLLQPMRQLEAAMTRDHNSQ